MTKNNNIGSISSGTMRAEDLIPTFLGELESQKPLSPSHRELVKTIRTAMEDEEYYESGDAEEDLDALFDALGDYAPEYFYFGAHPGDGSDYGYWLMDEWEDRLVEDGGIKVNDLSEIPAQHYGLVALVSDHGNVTLYTGILGATKNELVELWSIV
jgi:hypothetical protein